MEIKTRVGTKPDTYNVKFVQLVYNDDSTFLVALDDTGQLWSITGRGSAKQMKATKLEVFDY